MGQGQGKSNRDNGGAKSAKLKTRNGQRSGGDISRSKENLADDSKGLQGFMAHRPLPAIPPNFNGSPSPTDATVAPPTPEPDVPTFNESDPSCFLVQHDFEATDSTMLSIKKGELIKIHEKEANTGDWGRGQNSKGEVGWVPYAYLVENESLNRYDWYHGKISRNRAEYLLSSGINGSFLIRESESSPGQYSLSVRHEGRVYHYRVNNDNDGSMYVQEGIKFKSIPELVTYHNQEPGGLIACLRYAAPKLDKPTVYSISPECDQWEVARQEITISQKLGGGQYGEVYKAEYRKFHKTVAVKTLKEDATDVEEFLKEAEMMKHIRHPNLVQLIGVCTQETPIYIITEYMPRGNLLDYLRNPASKDIPATTLLYMATQVAAAMDYLEKQSFIHRDLAARNCLVGENHLIKVADFGLARGLQSNYYKAHAGAKFPIKWTAPEALAYNKFSSKSDVWAFGILMWEIATYGMSPYPGRELSHVYTYLEQGNRLDRPEGCPEPTYQLMLRCWAWEPVERPSFEIIHQELNTMFSSTNVEDEVADTLRREHSTSQAPVVKGYTQTLIRPRDGKPPELPLSPRVADHDRSNEVIARKERPILPKDRPPAPPPEPTKVEMNVEGRPPMPLPNKGGETVLASSPPETPSRHQNSPKTTATLKDRPQLPIPMGKRPLKITESNESYMKGKDSRRNENHLATTRSDSLSNISLNELSKGLGALKSVKRPPGQAKNPVLDSTDGPSTKASHLPGIQELQKRPLPRKPNGDQPIRPARPVCIVEGQALTAGSQESESKPVPAPRKTVKAPERKTNGSVPMQPDVAKRPLPPRKPSNITGGQKPEIIGRKPQMSKVVKGPKVKHVEINMNSLKPNLIPVAEEMQNLYRCSCDIITLAEARVSENIKDKSGDCVSTADSLHERLSTYRDSLGPVTRMKVNKHITSLEEGSNEFKSLLNELPDSPNAVELSRICKMLSGLVDIVETLSKSLPDL